MLSNAERTANRYIYISDFTTSQAEILSTLEALTQQTWKRTEADAFSLRKEGEALWEKGNVGAAARPLILGNLLGDGEGTLVQEDRLENEALGVAKTTMEEEIRGILSASGFTGQ